MLRRCIVIAGPTATGKTDLSVQLAKHLPIEIVNADSAQMYSRFSIGTALPDLATVTVPHHLFAFLDRPQDFDVASYRRMVSELVKEIQGRGNVPVFVGGSLFYIKSLLYSFSNIEAVSTSRQSDQYQFDHLSQSDRWELLHKVDPVRAKQIHPHDVYRTQRALVLWEQTGKMPSELVPQYSPMFPLSIFCLLPDRKKLYERIDIRTNNLFEQGWLDEVRDLLDDSSWRDFVLAKKFIGYPELVTWLEGGERLSLDLLIAEIQKKTRNYAKRQETFWRYLVKSISGELSEKRDHVVTCRVLSQMPFELEQLVEFIEHDIANYDSWK